MRPTIAAAKAALNADQMLNSATGLGAYLRILTWLRKRAGAEFICSAAYDSGREVLWFWRRTRDLFGGGTYFPL